ncbi:hypothetical protein SUGI_0710610 [Cryptomeria japonica]|nr:hypothetical protein SUGI_0710610 [Cryptomeria japonica]
MTTGKSPKWRDNSSAGCQWLEGPHIFLCHSGAQKDFTHQLWVDLVGQHRHTFFDIESLPHARYFPGVVFNAAANCKLAVFVLSEEFFTGSIWPMLELQIILHAINSGKNPQLKLFPLFYRISTQYMKDPTNERRWLQKWQEWVTTDSRLNITACTKALSVLKSYSGLVYQPGIGEVNYRRMVVDAICEIVPPFITADLTYVQGANRICQEIISKLSQLRCEESNIAPDTNFLAVYGKHGIGKTTLCKILCNYFPTQAGWRVCHIQVGNGQDHLAQQKLALKHLTGASQSLLEAVTNNDEV